MTIAQKIFDRCMKTDCPSNALAGTTVTHSTLNDYIEETTIYRFTDGSRIEDCNGELTLIED